MTPLQATASKYPPATRGTVVVWGLLAAYPFGGMTWQGLHYLVGLRQLGFDVWYVEDSDITLLDPKRNWPTMDSEPNARFLARHMEAIGLSDRWVFRPPDERNDCYGSQSLSGLAGIYRRADAVINLCGSHAIRDDHRDIKRLIYLQTDPTEDQIRIANGDASRRAKLDAHHFHFTYAENIGVRCSLPTAGYQWHPTRPPVIVDWWEDAGPPTNEAFTTITNWKQDFGKNVVYEGKVWGWNKQDQIRRFIDLPKRSRVPVEMAASALSNKDEDMLRGLGWSIRPATEISDPMKYRRYIRESFGEFTVAKEQYTLPCTGWFSDRSACYLAAGRPVIAQDTGFGLRLPTGEGLFSFQGKEDVLEAIDAISADYSHHCEQASIVAHEYFDAPKVIAPMLEKVGLL